MSIAIIDSAVDGDHPDLRGRVRLARNLVADHPLARNGEIHGTAIAGIIASAVNNREGIIGVAPDVSIAALRACWAVADDGLAAQCSTLLAGAALSRSRSGLHPNVINLSLAGPDDPLLSRLLDRVIERGIVVVTAHPASSESSLAFPSSHPHVLTAHSSLVAVNSDSPYTLAAPADEVLTTTPGAGYAFLTGNSLAAAHTTGVIALLMERQPDLDAERIAAILTATTTYSAGSASINACRAVARVAGAASCLAPREQRALLKLVSRAVAPQRIRHAEHVVIRVGIAKIIAPLVVAVVVAQIERHAADELRDADVPMRDLGAAAAHVEVADRAADLDVARQRKRDRDLLVQRRAAARVVLIVVGRGVEHAVAKPDARADLVVVVAVGVGVQVAAEAGRPGPRARRL